MKITEKEWDERLKKLQEESKKCKNIAELMQKTNYSRFIIESIFEHFPKETETIRSNLLENKSGKKDRIYLILDKSKRCKTLHEISQETLFSAFIIREELKKHPKVREKVMQNLEKNKQLKKDVKDKKTQRKETDEERIKKILEARKECKTLHEISQKTSYSYFIIQNTLKKFPKEAEKIKDNLKSKLDEKKSKEKIKIIMIDTSICNVENIFDILQNYVQEGKKIGITDLVLNEITGVQNSKSNDSNYACKFLHIIMENIIHFEYFQIKEKVREKETADQAIIEACFPIREKTILLTADKEMYIHATFQNVKAVYMPKNKTEKNNQNLQFKLNLINKIEEAEAEEKIKKTYNKKNIRVLANTYIENGELFYIKPDNQEQFTKIFSRFGEEKNGVKISLTIGDHIYICTKKEDYISFIDFEIYSITEKLGKSIYVYKQYDYNTIVNLENPSYKKFVQEAVEKFKVI